MINRIAGYLKKINFSYSPKNSADLTEWRNWLADALFFLGIVLIPFSMFFTVPTFLKEKHFDLLFVDIFVCIVLVVRIIIGPRSYKFWGRCWLIILYIMTLSFYIKLGPHYARSAWLVMNTVFAALFFGLKGALITSLFNPIILFGCYLFIGPENTIWVQVHNDTFLKYVGFVINTSSIALATSLPVGILLDRLEMSYQKQKQINEKLNESEKRYRLIAENVADVIWTMDMNFNFQYISPSIYSLQGFTAEEGMKKNITELLAPGSYKKILKLYEHRLSLVKSGSDEAWEPLIFEAEQYKKDGTTIWTSTHARILPQTKTTPMYILGITRDITESKRTREMIIQSEKMMSVGGLAAGMAHEINNPLAGVIQNATVLANRLTNPDIPANVKAAQSLGTTMETIHRFMEARNITHLVKAITDSGARISTIVDNMLSFARKGESSRSDHHPVALVEKTLELAGTDYDLKKQYDFKSITIQKEYEDNLPMLPCEASKIQQVLLNILNNGAHAMFEDPKVTNPVFILRIQHEPLSDMITIEIEDNGPGMDKQTCKRIFEPFFTTKPPGVGTGLGLSVSYFIVTEDHKGEMRVVSEKGNGTAFIIRLPIKKKE